MNDVLGDRVAEACTALGELARRSAGPEPPAVPAETLLACFAFLSDVVDGATAGEAMQAEAASWRGLVSTCWDRSLVETRTLEAALDALVDQPVEPARPVEPRPDLWRRLHADGAWVGVLDTRSADDGLELRFLTVVVDGCPHVVLTTTEATLDELVADRRAGVRPVHVPGHHLARIWPRAHRAVFDPGRPDAVVLDAGEMTGLPFGPSVAHGALDDVKLTEPAVDDWRHERLQTLVDRIAGLDDLVWRVLPDGNDLLAATTSDDPAAVMSQLAGSAPAFGFAGSLAIHADTDLGRTATRS